MFAGVKRGTSFFQAFLDLLYPPVCAECQTIVQKGIRSGGHPFFCVGCWSGIKRLDGAGPRQCPICAFPFPSAAALSHSPGHHCSECREKAPAFSKAITPFAYEGPLAKAIHLFKYRKKTQLAAPLAQLIVDDLGALSVDRVAAIPLHPRRLRAREYNQSLLLADRIARLLALPLLVDPMERTRETPPQVGLSKSERAKNLRRAFTVGRPELIREQRILLIDDVYTTGATLREGAKTLIRAGAKEVIVAAVARMI
jgi:ComF family protein